MKFLPGDIVRLKAPHMMVESISSGEDVHCVWFEGSEPRRGSFHISSLDVVKLDDDVEFIEDGSKPAPDPEFISEEDENPSGLETNPATHQVDQLANSHSLAETAKDTIEAFRKPAA